MSSDPLLSKMDALLKKHRGEAEPEPPAAAPAASNAPPPLPDDAWLPVLTDVVAVEEVPSEVVVPQTPVAEAAPSRPEAPPADANALIEQILRELEPKLAAMLHERLAAEIRIRLDDAVSSLIAEMGGHIHEVVQATVSEQLGKQA